MNLTKLAIHPDAELYPMMPEDELEALAADIKANGLLHPLVVMQIDGVDTLVDGRNRLKACQIAGVEPTTVALDGQDPKAYILAANVLRRHMPKGQKAMAVAFQYPEAPNTGRGKKSGANDAVKKLNGSISDARVSQARAVLRHSRELATAVLRGGMTLDDALDRVRADQAAAESEEALMARLRATAPDLADAVDEGRLKVNEAIAANEARQRDEEQRRRIATENVTRAIALLAATESDHIEQYVSGLMKTVYVEQLDKRTARRASKILQAIAERLP